MDDQENTGRRIIEALEGIANELAKIRVELVEVKRVIQDKDESSEN